jgi:hypothetical protein
MVAKKVLFYLASAMNLECNSMGKQWTPIQASLGRAILEIGEDPGRKSGKRDEIEPNKSQRTKGDFQGGTSMGVATGKIAFPAVLSSTVI